MGLQNALAQSIALHGESAVADALDSAGLFASLDDHSRHAVRAATRALTCGDVDGVLLFRFPGLPGEAVGATFITGDVALLLTADARETR